MANEWPLAGAETSYATTADGLVTIYNEMAIFASTPELVTDQVATKRVSSKNITNFTSYTNLTAISSALTEANEVTSVAVDDTAIPLTSAEYGNAVTRTLKLKGASINSLDASLAYLVGRNMGTSMDGLAVAAADAYGGTAIYPNDASSAATCGADDIMDKTVANRGYNKLARTNTPPLFGGLYVAVAHDDVLHDLRADSSSGGWTDVGRYANPQSVLQNEVGTFAGIRWLRSGNATVTSDGGVGGVDTYATNIFGFNALGRADTIAPGIRITGPFDVLGRFLNIGWFWYGVYDTISAANQQRIDCASSVGANT